MREFLGDVPMKYVITTVASVMFASSVFSHHSDADLDMNTLVTIEGTVTEFNWRNPHVYFVVGTRDESGASVEWALQMGSTVTVSRMGWTRDSLSIGDRVTVQTRPARNGRPYGLLDSIEKQSGSPLPTSFNRDTGEPLLTKPEATVSSSTLEGRWMADTSKLINYPGGFDGFFRANLNLTEKGKVAQAVFDESSDENPALNCIGRPTPSMIITTNLYPLEIRINEDEETVEIRSEYFDDERTVYMDGREHPETSERTHAGHSIGWWEDDVLVVDTRHLADHRSPYQTGVPSGAQKHVVERYRLTEDGTRIVVEFMLEDPEYLVESMSHTRELVYSPHMEMSSFDCDSGAARRFITE